MTEGTGLPPGSVVLVGPPHKTFRWAYQNDLIGAWHAGVGHECWEDSRMAETIHIGNGEVIHKAPDPDQRLARFLWDLFEAPHGAEPWELAGDFAQRNQVGYAKRVREYIKQEEEGK